MSRYVHKHLRRYIYEYTDKGTCLGTCAGMAPPRRLSTPRALKVRIKTKRKIGHEIGVFLTDLRHILHSRSCNHFLWFPHTPKPPWPLKRPTNFNFAFFFFFPLSLFWLIFQSQFGLWLHVPCWGHNVYWTCFVLSKKNYTKRGMLSMPLANKSQM